MTRENIYSLPEYSSPTGDVTRSFCRSDGPSAYSVPPVSEINKNNIVKTVPHIIRSRILNPEFFKIRNFRIVWFFIRVGNKINNRRKNSIPPSVRCFSIVFDRSPVSVGISRFRRLKSHPHLPQAAPVPFPFHALL